MSDAGQFVVHTDPVWRDRSDFIINAELPLSDQPRRFEQLFAKKLGEDQFEVCCIPFFLYDVALGDIVRTVSRGGRNHVVERVVRPSGRYVFRVWFGESPDPQDLVIHDLEEVGSLIERSSRNLLAVDAVDLVHAQVVADLLSKLEQAGQLSYETGRS